MRDLHEQLRSLVSQHGVAIAENADQFRAALDDFLTEEDASQGELNLLVDAVRLGGVERLKTMLDNGADPEAAVREAGGELARDRSSDEQRARWAVAVLGYALGRVGIGTVRSQLEGDATRLPYGATAPAAQRPPAQSAPYQPPPAQSPPHQTHQPQQQPQQQAWPGQQGYAPAGYAPQQPRKSRGGLVAALVAGALAVAVAVVLIVVAPWSDDSKDDDNGGDNGGGGGTAAGCDPCVEGDGYKYQLPDGWQDVTDTIPESSSGGAVLDTAAALGGSIESSRANVIVEISAWVYTDLDDAKETFTTNLESSLTDPVSEEIEGREIDGEEAVGIRVTSTNANDIEVEQTAYLMRRDSDAIVIYASNEVGDEGPKDAYSEIYDSWTWED